MALTQERLKELLSYDPETGIFRWLKGRGGMRAGSVAGKVTETGYLYICIDRQLLLAHRLAWIYVSGAAPAGLIDHVNGDPSDNRIVNLRNCTQSQNMKNVKGHFDSRSGFKGVYTRNGGRSWFAKIFSDGKPTHLGTFPSKLEAAAAYDAAARAIHGDFARLNEAA
jgi:hypothetical protein